MSITERFLGFALLGAEWVMWVLIALSLFSIAIMIERVIYFWGQRPSISAIIEDMGKALSSGDFEAARRRIESVRGVAPSVGRIAMKEAERGFSAVDEAAASAMIREKLKLEKNLAFLGTVGNNAPFIGLFGTVIGIIQAFNQLSFNTQGGAAAVMAGISEALVATAIGLLVAIPAVAAFNIFQRRIKALLGDADALVHALLSGMENPGSASKEG
ncbi:MAG: MotA/TolQ/ExbB proton channel family protein [Polyangia bacterium]